MKKLNDYKPDRFIKAYNTYNIKIKNENTDKLKT